MQETKHPDIALSPVKSSQIASIGYDASTNTMAVKFNSGGVYHYQGVSEKQFAEFKNAKSLGSHFGKAIRGNFKHTKLPDVKK